MENVEERTVEALSVDRYLLFKSTVVIFFRALTDDGTMPFSWFPEQSNFSRLDRAPI